MRGASSSIFCGRNWGSHVIFANLFIESSPNLSIGDIEMKGKELMDDDVINNWWKRIDARDSTRIRYVQGIAHFFTFIEETELPLGKTPEKVLEYARTKVKEDVLLWRDEIEGIFANFEDWLKNKTKVLNSEEQAVKLAPKTVKNNIAAVRSFFNAYNIDVPKRKNRQKVKTLVENNHRLTKDIVKEAIKYADVRQKAIILCMLSAGFGDSDILNLRVDNFIKGRGYMPQRISDLKTWIIEEKRKCEEAINEGTFEFGITTLFVRREKTSVDYYTFLTPEATLAILDYLAWRNRETEYVKNIGIGKLIEEKKKIRSPNDYLFIKTTIDDWYLPPEDIEKIRPPRKEHPEDRTATKLRVTKVKEKRKELGLTGYADEIRKFDRSGLISILRRLAKKAGIDTKFGVYQVLRGHNLRKLFYTLLRNEGVDYFTVEYWMGHTIPDEQAAYFEAIPEKLKEIYAKYMHVLFIGDYETKVLASREYTELNEKLTIYEAALKERNGEISKLRDEIEEMKAKGEAREPLDDMMSLMTKKPEMRSAMKKMLISMMNEPEMRVLMKKVLKKE